MEATKVSFAEQGSTPNFLENKSMARNVSLVPTSVIQVKVFDMLEALVPDSGNV